MGWLDSLFGGDTASKLVDSVGDAAIDIRSAITGDLPPDIKLKMVEQANKLSALQVELNLEDAKNSSLFIAGWRPYIGWTCGIGLSYEFAMRPFLEWACLLNEWVIPPHIDSGVLMPLVTALLGIGTMRSWEKAKGVHRSH